MLRPLFKVLSMWTRGDQNVYQMAPPSYYSKWWASMRISNARWQMCLLHDVFKYEFSHHDAVNTMGICLKTQRHGIPASRFRRWKYHWRCSCLWCSFKSSRNHGHRTIHAVPKVVELFVLLVLQTTSFLNCHVKACDVACTSIKAMRVKYLSSWHLVIAGHWDPAQYFIRSSWTHWFHIL